MKFGVLGGTFDPIHNGHIVLAEEARTRLALDEVIFVPAGEPWLRVNTSAAPAQHRLEMVRLATSDISYFRVSTVDLDRRGPTHTVDTIADLQSQLGGGAELYFILGQDSLAELPGWWQPERLIQMCRLVAVPRPGYPVPDVGSMEAAIPGISQRLILLDKPEIDVSATQIRERVAQGLYIGHLVPEPVDKYIRQNRLYMTQ